MIAIDTETTGLKRPDACEEHLQPYIIEIYLCKFDYDGNIIDEFDTLVKPPIPISEVITQITGITNEDVADAPTFIEIYDDLAAFCLGETDWFAHNLSFDAGVIESELHRHGLEFKFPWPINHNCTVEISYPINNKRLKLGQLYQMATGKEMKNAHRAKSDVVQMVEAICWLKEEGFIID